MRIAYISHTRFPTEKAHGFQMAQVCAALASLGHEVTLFAPDLHTAIAEPYDAYYGVTDAFHVQKVPAFDALHSWFIPGRFAFIVSMVSYRRALTRNLHQNAFDLLYLRSPSVLGAVLRSGVRTVLELHTLPRCGRGKFVEWCNGCAVVVCLTGAMRDGLVAMGVEAKRVVVEGDAVDLDRFADLPSPADARHSFALPGDRRVVGYLGSLVTMDHMEKGVDVLIEALALLKQRDTYAFGWIVGGPEGYRERYRDAAQRQGLTAQDVRFDAPIPPMRVPDALRAMDVCVYPAPASGHAYFRRDTSPLKLFEYLASGTSVVCADIPPVRDVVDDSIVKLVAPGNAVALRDGIAEVLGDPASAKFRAEKGRLVVKEHTWKKRMERILAAL